MADPEQFVADLFGRRAALTTPDFPGSNPFVDLLGPDVVDHLLNETPLRQPNLRLVKDGVSLPSSRYTISPRVGSSTMSGLADPAKVVRLLDDGATLVLQALHRVWPPLRSLAHDLAEDLGHPIQVNAYVTPADAQGFAVHSDSHDVFVMQTFGSKMWEIHREVIGAKPPQDGITTLDLQPGDVLYLPKGSPHSARAQDGYSGHITVGIHGREWRDLLLVEVKRALDSPEFGERVPARFDRDIDFGQQIVGRLAGLAASLEDTDPSEAAERAQASAIASAPLSLSNLADRLRLADLSDDWEVRVRPGRNGAVVVTGEQLILSLPDRTITMPDWVAPAIDRLRNAPSVRVGDLGLDEESRLVLVRRLVREDVLEIVPV